MNRPAMTLKEKVSSSHSALLIVDMQKDFCCPGGAYGRIGLDVSSMRAVVPRVQQLVEAARNKQIPVLWIIAKSDHLPPSPVRADIGRRRFVHASKLFGLRENHAPGEYLSGMTPGGREMVPGLRPGPGEPLIMKAGYGAFEGTPLDTTLRNLGARTVVLAGVATNICVESTARSACDKGYYVVIVEDCTATVTDHLHRVSLEVMNTYFGEVVLFATLVQTWGS